MSRCPVPPRAGNDAPATTRRRSLRARFHAWGLRALGRSWLPGHLAAPFPGVLAHHRGPSLFTGHAKAFHRATVVHGRSASAYFRASGISACAETNGGICTFRMGRRIALYQITNVPLTDDDALAPSTDANRELFGDFIGSQPNDHPCRPVKRAAVERTLGNAAFVGQLEPAVRKYAAEYFRSTAGRELPLDDFVLGLVTHVDSFLPGVLDLTQRPLSEYLSSPRYGRVMRDLFELASDVISKINREAMREVDMVAPFVRDLLDSNAEALAHAPETNMIRRHFAVWDLPVSPAGFARLTTAQLKELGTIIVATYDTTALSLHWALAYLETSPEHKRSVVAAAHDGGSPGPSAIDLAVLEAVRLGGSNPAALWRRTTRPFTLEHRGRSVTVPVGTMLWLDRRQANQDPRIFPAPDRFDPDNIRAIFKSGRETVSSVLSRNRYEINSFSMVNSERNPRKCPGRLFSVRMQSMLLAELYAHYEVTADGIDLRLKDHSSMPRPARPGTVLLTPTPSAGPARTAHATPKEKTP
ncbi:cytochrome P450 [Streptomyces noursei]|uniref:cytochrome P450 n=1 Tax=Streptomyces noursei TaxID=1971 RepID=UPI0030F00586